MNKNNLLKWVKDLETTEEPQATQIRKDFDLND